jgi:uncharacterized protein YcgI (DUF1989 family)
LTLSDEGDPRVSQFLIGRMAVKAKQIRPGEGFAVEVKKDELIQIITVDGKQVAQVVAFSAADPTDRLSTSVTRAKSKTIMLQKDKVIYSAGGVELLKVIEDTVGRHDIFYPVSDAMTPNPTEGLEPLPSTRAALANALSDFGVSGEQIPDPVNLFMRVSILQKGEIEIQESLSEKGDYVVLQALNDVIVAIAGGSAEQNGGGAKSSELLVRIFR